VKSTILIAGKAIDDRAVECSLWSARLARGESTSIVVAVSEAFTPEQELSATRRNPWIEVVQADAAGAIARIESDYVFAIDAGTEIKLDVVSVLDRLFMKSDVAVAYGDSEGVLRPAWSPYRFLSEAYFGESVAFRPTVIAGLAPRQRVAHVPSVLAGGSPSHCSTMNLLQRSLEHHARSTYGGSSVSSVAIVIPTNGAVRPGDSSRSPMIVDLLETLMPLDSRVRDVVVVADTTMPPETLSSVGEFDRVKVVPYDRPFNFSDKCNIGALAVDADVVVFLNDDMLALTPDWVDTVLRYLSDGAVGAVGGLLVTENGLVQCAGHANSPVPHIYGAGLDPTEPKNERTIGRTREASGLSGACIAVRRDDYLQVGGMCTALANSYNDVDLGFKLIRRGMNLIYTPEFRFVHFESASRNPQVEQADLAVVRARWGAYLDRDPFPVG
jgi:GT2 family glycosyltransferase